jgi:transposase
VGNKVVMTNDRQLKATVREAGALADAGASEGARRATGDAPASAAKVLPANAGGSAGVKAGMEVVAGGRRRSFSKADKQRILEAAERCTAPGEVGALLRREAVYSSSLSTWRKQRKAAELAALAPHKRGPKPAADRDQVLQIAHLRRDNDRLQSRLDKALFVIEIQKKVAALLGQPIDDSDENT